MPCNVEIKAKLRDRQRVLEIVRRLSGSKEGTTLVQEDTFFAVPNGRLKLRVQTGCPGQLIFYNRSDQAGPKLSQYTIAQIHKPADVKATLGSALGILGTVQKTRRLFMVGQTRVHIDEVKGLGEFLELEVVMSHDQSLSEGQQISEELMEQLGIGRDDLITCAYLDLLLKQMQNSD